MTAPGTPLVLLWRACTHNLRRWLARRVSARQQDRSGDGVVSGGGDDAGTGPEAFAAVGEEVVARARLLLRLRPVDEEASQEKLASARRAMMKSMHGRERASSSAGLELGGRGWAVLRRMLRAGTLETLKWRINAISAGRDVSGSGRRPAWVEVVAFLQSGISANEMERILLHASRRAVCRVYGLKVYQSILSGYAAQVSDRACVYPAAVSS